MRNRRRLSSEERTRIVRWGKRFCEEETVRERYAGRTREIVKAASVLRDILMKLTARPKSEGDYIELVHQSLARPHHFGEPHVKTLREMTNALANFRSALRFVEPLRPRVARKKPALRLDGRLVKGGRHESTPRLRLLVNNLMRLTDGGLTFDNKTGKGTLADELDSLRSELPDMVPPKLPNTKLGRMVTDWRRSQPAQTPP